MYNIASCMVHTENGTECLCTLYGTLETIESDNALIME